MEEHPKFDTEPVFEWTGGCDDCGTQTGEMLMVRLGKEPKVWRLCCHCRDDHRRLDIQTRPANGGIVRG